MNGDVIVMNSNLQTAITWLNMGVSPIPVIPRTKMPAVDWKMWQDRTPPIKVVDHWFRGKDENIGVICGGKHNLCIIDFDDIDQYHIFRRDTNNTCENFSRVAKYTYRVRTPRGMHLYLFTEKRENSRKYPETHIDVRCSGNYTLVPPSIHPSGLAYESIGDISSIVTIPTIEAMFPDPVQKYIELAEKRSNTPTDIFDIAERVTISDIKKRINILSFVAQFSKVNGSKGGRWFHCRCINPLHNDKHPSFRIDTVNQRAKCLSPGCKLYHDIGHDVIDLYKIIHNVTTIQAIKEMSEMY